MERGRQVARDDVIPLVVGGEVGGLQQDAADAQRDALDAAVTEVDDADRVVVVARIVAVDREDQLVAAVDATRRRVADRRQVVGPLLAAASTRPPRAPSVMSSAC